MTDKTPPKTMSDEHNSFHAEQRRKRRDAAQGGSRSKEPFMRGKRPSFKREDNETLYLYGLHTVRQALLNDARKKHKLYATKNAQARLEKDLSSIEGLKIEETSPKALDRMVGSDAVHQGAVLHVEPLKPKRLDALASTDLILLLDQVTDPHNVGAIMRSCVAMNAGAIITTSRFSPVESGVLAKSASGALDLIDHIEVRNLAETLEHLSGLGFTTTGLDSKEALAFEEMPPTPKIALVLGSEGKGLRSKTRLTCDTLVKLTMPGAIHSLNVSNAAILGLYLSRQKIT